MGFWKNLFGSDTELESTVPEKPAADLTPIPYELQVPWLPNSLLEILKRRKAGSQLVNWNVKEGDRVGHGSIIAEFNLDWSGINTGSIFKKRRSEILGGSVKMTCSGIIRFTSTSENDKCFCSIQPLTEERGTFRYRNRYKGVSREAYENDIKWWIDPHTFYFPTCEAIWMFLRYDPQGKSGEDPDRILNREIKLIDTIVVSRDF